MVKKWIVMIVIVAILTVGCIFESNFVNGSFDFLSEQLTIFETMIDQDKDHIDSETNIEFMENLHNEWHKKASVLKTLIWHTGMKDVEVGLSRIKTYTSENDYTEALAELSSLIDYVEHYSADFDLNLENLF